MSGATASGCSGGVPASQGIHLFSANDTAMTLILQPIDMLKARAMVSGGTEGPGD